MKNYSILFASMIVLAIASSCNNQYVEPSDIDKGSGSAANARISNENNDNRNFSAHLSFEEEVAPAGATLFPTNATGQANFKLSKDGTELYFKLIVANIENVRFAHIHIGAKGTNGPVTTFLKHPPTLTGSVNGVIAEGVITSANLIGPLAGATLADLIAAMEAGNAYVNVHTDLNPSGEVRGQIQ